MRPLPKSWNEVTIPTFLEYYTLINRKWDDSIDLEVNILAVFHGCSVKDIEDMDMSDIKKEIKALEWLKDLPDTKIPTHFKLDGKAFKAHLLFRDQKAAQFMQFSQVCKGVKPEDYVYHIHELIACMCTRKEWGLFFECGMVKLWRYKYDGYEANAEIFKQHMTIGQAYPFYVFFCKVIETLPDYTHAYLMKETKKLMGNRSKLALLRKWIGSRITGAGKLRSTP